VALPSFTGNFWSGFAASSSRNAGSIVAGSLPMIRRGRRARCRAPSGRAQAAEEVHLERGRLRELVRGELGAALIEVVRDAHRADRVRARRARTDLCRTRRRRSSPGPWTSSRRRGRETAEPWERSPRPPRRGLLARRRSAPESTATAPIMAERIMKARRSMPCRWTSAPDRGWKHHHRVDSTSNSPLWEPQTNQAAGRGGL
jgi:hypothetical protein